jgi:hypothetical protein
MPLGFRRKTPHEASKGLALRSQTCPSRAPPASLRLWLCQQLIILFAAPNNNSTQNPKIYDRKTQDTAAVCEKCGMALRTQDPDLVHLLPPKGSTELPISLQFKVVRGFWGNQISKPFQPDQYLAYFKYFRSECENWQASGDMEIETYGDLLDLAKHLKDNRTETLASSKLLSFFPQIKSRRTERVGLRDVSVPVSQRYPDCEEESVHNAVYLTVRLWLMINVGSASSELFTGRSKVSWARGHSMDNVINHAFRKCQSWVAPHHVRWPKTLNARRLERIGGLEITWTSNLADHLYFDEDLKTISIFHHARFLRSFGETAGMEYVVRHTIRSLRTG